MFTRMLVPLDGSERAERALPVAAQLAQALHGTPILLRVVQPALQPATRWRPRWKWKRASFPSRLMRPTPTLLRRPGSLRRWGCSLKE